MRHAVFALVSSCMFVSLALIGGPAQAGAYGGGYGYGEYGYIVGAGGGSGCQRGLFGGCRGYYQAPPVRSYAPPPVRYVAPPPPPRHAEPLRRCRLVPTLDGRGGWIWAPNPACP